MVQSPESVNFDRLRFARELVEALERADTDAENRAVHAILGLHEKRLHSNLARIATDLREALSASQFDDQLSRLTQNELPDAQHRLNRVIELTEAAADTSLTAVETALPLVRNIRASLEKDSEADADEASRQIIEKLADDAEQIEKCLSEVLMAQGFQDITGQIIRRIVKLVGDLEACLSSFAVPGVDELSRAEDEKTLRAGKGPAVQGVDSALEHQDDVDDLLGQLGL